MSYVVVLFLVLTALYFATGTGISYLILRWYTYRKKMLIREEERLELEYRTSDRTPGAVTKYSNDWHRFNERMIENEEWVDTAKTAILIWPIVLIVITISSIIYLVDYVFECMRKSLEDTK